jgi:hypothetical protein
MSNARDIDAMFARSNFNQLVNDWCIDCSVVATWDIFFNTRYNKPLNKWKDVSISNIGVPYTYQHKLRD